MNDPMIEYTIFAVCLYLKRVFVRAGDDSSSVLHDLCTSDAAQLNWTSPELILLMETTCQQQLFLFIFLFLWTQYQLLFFLIIFSLFCSAGEAESIYSLSDQKWSNIQGFWWETSHTSFTCVYLSVYMSWISSWKWK